MATRHAFIVGCLTAALAAAPPPARAAVRRDGDWDSRGPFPPVAGTLATVDFEVSGPPSRRVVRRVAAPPWCTADPASTGCLSAGNAAAPVRADGRPLSLLGADPLIAAPIGRAARFAAVGTQPPLVHISGTFDHGAVAALPTVADAQPDGVSCRARGIPVVGALAFPFRRRTQNWCNLAAIP